MPSVDAGWSSLVARRAHNPKVVGSNPAPATTIKNPIIGVFYYAQTGNERLKAISQAVVNYSSSVLRL